MKITHRIPPNWVRPSSQIDPAYQREIDLTLHRAAKREHQRAVGELKKAERARRRREDEVTRQAVEAARVQVQTRYEELRAIESLMQQSAAFAARRARIVGDKPSQI